MTKGGPGFQRLRAAGKLEEMRQRTLAEQRKAVDEVQALRNQPATPAKPEQRWQPGNHKDYPNGKGPTATRGRKAR